VRRTYFNVGNCPMCGSGRVEVRSTRKPFRHLRCKICKKSWKTLEIVMGKNWVCEVLADLLDAGQLSGHEHLLPEIGAICNHSLAYLYRRRLAQHGPARDNIGDGDD